MRDIWKIRRKHTKNKFISSLIRIYYCCYCCRCHSCYSPDLDFHVSKMKQVSFVFKSKFSLFSCFWVTSWLLFVDDDVCLCVLCVPISYIFIELLVHHWHTHTFVHSFNSKRNKDEEWSKENGKKRTRLNKKRGKEQKLNEKQNTTSN